MVYTYSDVSNSNFFVGNCRFGNYDIDLPNTDFLRGEPISNFEAAMLELCDLAGLQYAEIISQTELENTLNGTVSKPLIRFSTSSDASIDSRYEFSKQRLGGNSTTQNTPAKMISLLKNDGSSAASITRNDFLQLPSSTVPTTKDNNLNSALSKINFLATANSNGLALLLFESRAGGNNMQFFYAGRTSTTNTSNSYYSATPLSNSIILYSDSENGGFKNVIGKHHISNNEKELLQTGTADFSLSCGAQTTNVSTYFYAFDNNSTFNYPAIGILDNLLLAKSSFAFMKPLKLTNAPSSSSVNVWIPVGTFANKTLLMRTYSTY